MSRFVSYIEGNRNKAPNISEVTDFAESSPVAQEIINKLQKGIDYKLPDDRKGSVYDMATFYAGIYDKINNRQTQKKFGLFDPILDHKLINDQIKGANLPKHLYDYDNISKMVFVMGQIEDLAMFHRPLTGKHKFFISFFEKNLNLIKGSLAANVFVLYRLRTEIQKRFSCLDYTPIILHNVVNELQKLHYQFNMVLDFEDLIKYKKGQPEG